MKSIWLSRTVGAAIPDLNLNARPARVVKFFRPFLEKNPIVALDVGARGGLPGEWEPLAPVMRLFAVEADPEEAESLRRRYAASHLLSATVIAAAAGPAGEYTLHVTREPGSSSLLEPNREVIERYGGVENFDVLERQTLTCRPLDALLEEAGADEVDLLKVDVQGFELEVLRTLGEERWRGVLMAESEVEFVELYRGQPLFRHVDEFVSAHGFELFLLNRAFANYRGGRWMPYGRGQIQLGDALYLRTQVENLPPARLGKLIVLAAYYGFCDYAFYLYANAVQQGKLAQLGEAEIAPFRAFFAPFENPRATPVRVLSTALRFVLDRALFTLLRWRKWNGLKTDGDRSYPLR